MRFQPKPLHLTHIAHIQTAADRDAVTVAIVARKVCHAPRLQPVKQTAQSGRRRPIRTPRRRGHVVVFEIGNDLGIGAQSRGQFGHQYPPEAHFPRQRVCTPVAPPAQINTKSRGS